MNKYISVDTETELIKGINIPFIATSTDHTMKSTLYDLSNKNDYNTLKSICESPEWVKIFHPATYDIYVLSNIGINVIPPYHCTMVMASLIDENFESKKLKMLARKYLKESCKEEIVLKELKEKCRRMCKNKGIKFSYKIIYEMFKREFEAYAIMDSVYTIKLFFLFRDTILKDYLDIYNMERKLIPVVVSMQKRGVNIDRVFIKQERNRIINVINREYNTILKKGNFIPNLNAPADIIKLLNDENIQLIKRTEKGNISTDKDVMKSIIREYPNSIAKNIMIYKNYVKQLSTYYDKLLYDYTDKQSSVAHFLFWQSGAKTGRFSADLIQTIPRESGVEDKELLGIENNVRRAFITREGYINYYIDYEQIEMRLFAHFSNDKKLINAILQGFDPHMDTAINLFGKEKAKSDKSYRKLAKTINFAIVYGAGVNRLANQLGIPLWEAQQRLLEYYAKYPTVKSFMNQTINDICRTGILYNEIFKRKYHIDKNHAYKGTNVIIQGSAAYIIKKAMIKIYDYFLKNKIDAHILLQIHDELVIEISKRYSEEERLNILRNIKKCMEDYKTFKVPITVDINYSENSWANKKEIRIQ